MSSVVGKKLMIDRSADSVETGTSIHMLSNMITSENVLM